MTGLRRHYERFSEPRPDCVCEDGAIHRGKRKGENGTSLNDPVGGDAGGKFTHGNNARDR